MSDRRRLSNAIRRAAQSAGEYREAQKEMHEAFEAVYGFDLCIEELNDDWTDPLVYGDGPYPSLAQFDQAVNKMRTPHE
ncbi:MAG: hypothetical protein ABJL49_05595 [Parasphingorhabdus sp.]|uniref:hypothetical protein n=1 Tax=Alphaproteobacteria TaxID=28211 RepID=UPI003264F5F4